MRPSIPHYMMQIAHVVSSRSTCARRAVGCVITDHNNHILSTGYNGVPRGINHCTDVPCEGSRFKSGEGLDICGAIHAEINAITHCYSLENAQSIFITTSPCMSCVKAILATKIRNLYFDELYDEKALNVFCYNGGRIGRVD